MEKTAKRPKRPARFVWDLRLKEFEANLLPRDGSASDGNGRSYCLAALLQDSAIDAEDIPEVIRFLALKGFQLTVGDRTGGAGQTASDAMKFGDKFIAALARGEFTIPREVEPKIHGYMRAGNVSVPWTITKTQFENLPTALKTAFLDSKMGIQLMVPEEGNP